MQVNIRITENIMTDEKKMRGRPKRTDSERLEVVPVRISTQTLERVKEWGRRQEPPADKSKAIRQLVENALSSNEADQATNLVRALRGS
jgi:uncharacterized protein (DUF4415 family)